MKSSVRFTTLCLAFIMIAMTVLPLAAITANGEEAVTPSFEVNNYTLHNIKDNSGYNLSTSNQTSVLASGHTRLGNLMIFGEVERKTYKDFESYAITGGEVRFEYTQTWSDSSYEGHNWKLNSDSATSINGSTTGTIGNGAVLILKSLDDGATWTPETSSVNINGKTVTFTPDGEDIQRGVLYKFVSVCEAYYEYSYQSGTVTKYPEYKDAPLALQLLGGPAAVGVWILANSWQEPKYSTDKNYQNFAQQTIVYLASDSCEVAFYNEVTENYDLSAEFPGVAVEDLEVLRTGVTLSHNSVSLSSFRLDKLGNKSFSVFCSYNEGLFDNVEDGQVFSAPGKYSFLITSKFGTVRKCDIYILDPGSDFAYSQFFGNSMVSQHLRVYKKDSAIPVYMIGTYLNVNVAPTLCLPGISGNIYRYADAAAVERGECTILRTYNFQQKAETFVIPSAGIYVADFYIGDPNACGDCIHYTFYFEIVTAGDYSPSVNFEMITSCDRKVLLKSACYTVSFGTAGGGCYLFMFNSNEEGYKEAISFAESIENRFIEEYEDNNGKKYYYYRSHGTSGLKTRFDSKVELYAEIDKRVKENVNLTYINSTEQYATMTLDEAIANVATTSIPKDIRVTINSETRNSMVSEDIIINGYKFWRASDYESEYIIATDERGNIISVPYDTPVEEIFTATGSYLISETNRYGTRQYSVNFIAPGDITGSIAFLGFKDYKEFSGTISKDSVKTIEANGICLVSGADKYDSQTLVTISTTGSRKTMLLSEIKEYTIIEPGSYTITLTNRCGYTTSVTIKITGAPETYVRFSECPTANKFVKYGSPLGNLPELEREGYAFVGWKDENGKLVTSSTLCSWQDSVVLTPCFEEIKREVEIILNYFNSYIAVSAEYGATVTLPSPGNVGDLLIFDYWELNGEPVYTLNITSFDRIVLVARYKFNGQ